MELVAIEATRVIYLIQVHRPAGQLFLPEAAAKFVARYSFAKPPSLDQLTSRSEHVTFRVGRFQGTQIEEARLYSDGVIVEARSNSRIIDAFVDDWFAWNEKELGLVPISTLTPERYYESEIIVKSSKNLTTVMGLKPEVAAGLNKLMSKSNYKARPYYPSGFVVDCDAHDEGGRRKPSRFVIDRRIGVAFSENVFFSQAPLATDDHLAFLENVEDLAR